MLVGHRARPTKKFATALRQKVDEMTSRSHVLTMAAMGVATSASSPSATGLRAQSGVYLRVVPRQRLRFRLNLAVIAVALVVTAIERCDRSVGASRPRAPQCARDRVRLAASAVQVGHLVLD